MSPLASGTTEHAEVVSMPLTETLQIKAAEHDMTMSRSRDPSPAYISDALSDTETHSTGLSLSPIAQDVSVSSEKTPIPHEMAMNILKVLETYSIYFDRGAAWEGLVNFLPAVHKHVEAEQPIQILLPGFPFKSPNSKDKVLGVLPDLGEELALGHLNSIGDNIKAVYEPGAEIYICSDGLVYNGMFYAFAYGSNNLKLHRFTWRF